MCYLYYCAKNKGRKMFTLNCKGKLLTTENPLIMGIINTTPDSFYEESRKPNVNNALQQAKKMIDDGASILDIGGQSTRPGSTRISAEEEMQRVIPVIEAIHKNFPDTIISIDTYYAAVAESAVNAGASIINDISGGMIDENMLAVSGSLNVPFVCTHIKGTPETMQQNPVYEDVVKEVLQFFIERIDTCLKHHIKDIILDVGFGFGKTKEHNFSLLKNLSVFSILQKPLLIGLSRKGMVYKPLDTTADKALNGTTVLNTLALMSTASVLRVHDVKEATEAVRLFSVYKNS